MKSTWLVGCILKFFDWLSTEIIASCTFDMLTVINLWSFIDITSKKDNCASFWTSDAVHHCFRIEKIVCQSHKAFIFL